MSEQQLPMHRKIFNNARYYSSGAALLYENIFAGKKSAEYAAPGVLCSTFCIELLLKCLVLIQHDDVFSRQDVRDKGIKLDDHLYSKIFSKIDVGLQSKVVEAYNTLFFQNISTTQYTELLSQLGNNGFVEWRYVYESPNEKNLNIQLQNQITDSLGKTIESIYKERGL